MGLGDILDMMDDDCDIQGFPIEEYNDLDKKVDIMIVLCREVDRHSRKMNIQDMLQALHIDEKLIGGVGSVSDGYHTFDELYHHRAVLFSVIVSTFPNRCWKSKHHHDGTMYDGMFIVGIDTPQGQASYHYDVEPYWDMFKCKEVECAPVWDGHTPAQAIERIGNLTENIPNIIETLIFAEKATGVSDSYTQGFCNGVVFARSLLENKDPIYHEPDEWANYVLSTEVSVAEE